VLHDLRASTQLDLEDRPQTHYPLPNYVSRVAEDDREREPRAGTPSINLLGG
jgi:hypothetical protein